MPTDFGKNLQMDTRMVDKVQRSAAMSQEQGSGFLADWGGPSAYKYLARQPMEDRMTYLAVQAGYTSVKDIADVTGLNTTAVYRSVGKLQASNMVPAGLVTNGGGLEIS